MTATLEPLPAADWFNPSRGWLFEPEMFVQTAGGQALAGVRRKPSMRH